MLGRALGMAVAAFLLPLVVAAPRAVADNPGCPSGTQPVSIGSGVICLAAVDPGSPGDTGDEGQPGDQGFPSDEGAEQSSAGCHKADGTAVPCQTSDGYWWSGSGCYAAPFDAPAGSPAWQGHTDGSLWQCTACEAAGNSNTCNVQTLWTAPGAAPAPPTPEELAATAFDQLQLERADIHTAPQAPAPTYVGVATWLWIPRAQWSTLTKSVTAGSTTVTVSAVPQQVLWDLGPASQTCKSPGRVWVAGMTDAATTTCSHVYRTTSADAAGGAFAVRATIRYQVTWACTGTCPTSSGDLGIVDAPVGSGSMRVLQRQTVVIR